MHSPPPDMPPEFKAVSERLDPGIDRKLGYNGDERYVLFYYDPRMEDVAWEDQRRHGLGTGGWCSFIDQIAPLADDYDVHLGSSDSFGEDALVLDRLTRLAWFAPRQTAKHFVSSRSSRPEGV